MFELEVNASSFSKQSIICGLASTKIS